MAKSLAARFQLRSISKAAQFGSNAHVVGPSGAEPTASPARRISTPSRRTPPNTSRPMAASAPMVQRWARSSTATRAIGRSSTASSISISTATSRPNGPRTSPAISPRPTRTGAASTASPWQALARRSRQSPASDRPPKPAAHQDQRHAIVVGHRLLPRGQDRAGTARLARGLCSHGDRRAASPPTIEPEPRRLHRRSSLLLPGNRQQGRPALRPASRRACPASCACLDENDARLRRFRRQPAIHHAQGTSRENPRAMIFLMDYANRRRVKIWGTARVVEHDAALNAQPAPRRLQGAGGRRNPVHRRGVGRQLPAAHPAHAVRRGCRPRRSTSLKAASASARSARMRASQRPFARF